MKSKTIFTEDDVNDLLPVVKQLNPRSKTASEAYMTALDEAGSNRKRAMECLDEAHAVMNSVYGPLHSEQVQCLRSLARSAYIAGAYVDAIRLQKKAVQTSERVNGLDHYLTVQEYVSRPGNCKHRTHVFRSPSDTTLSPSTRPSRASRRCTERVTCCSLLSARIIR